MHFPLNKLLRRARIFQTNITILESQYFSYYFSPRKHAFVPYFFKIEKPFFSSLTAKARTDFLINNLQCRRATQQPLCRQ